MHAFPLAVTLSLALAATPQGGGQEPKQNNVLKIESGTHQISDLITQFAEFLGESHLFNTNDPMFTAQGPISTIVLQTAMKVERNDARDVIRQLLFSRNLILTPIEPARGLFEWVNLNHSGNLIKERATFLDRESVEAHDRELLYVSTLYQLRYVDAMQLSSHMRILLQDNQNLTQMLPVARSNSVIITGFCPRVATILRLLGKLDRDTPKLNETLETRFLSIEQRLKNLERNR